MKTVIYLDELLLVNFLMGAALLLGTGLVCGQACSALRLCAGAAAAAAASLSLLAPELPAIPALFYKLFTCCGIVAAVYGFHGWRCFLRCCLWYTLLNFLVCGAALLPGAQSNNFSLYLPLSPGLLLLCCGGISLALRLLVACFGRAQPVSISAALELDGCALPLRAFYDTGFSMLEPLSGRPVVLVRYSPVRKLLSPPLQSFLDDYFSCAASLLPPPGLGVRLVPCQTVTGHCILPAVPAHYLHAGDACAQGFLAAFCASDFPGESWELLFGTDIAQQLGLV